MKKTEKTNLFFFLFFCVTECIYVAVKKVVYNLYCSAFVLLIYFLSSDSRFNRGPPLGV